MHAPTTGEIVHVGKLGGFPERNLIFFMPPLQNLWVKRV